MKHAQHILAVDKAAFGIEPMDGWIDMTPKAMFEAVGKSLFIGRRAELEADERFGQILPYVVLYQKTEAAPKVFVYQRTKKVGEQRLAGMMSVGVGGHVDLLDSAVGEDSVIDVVSTFARTIARELNEEIGFHLFTDATAKTTFDGLRQQFVKEQKQSPFPKFVGLINDHSDAVGLVHYGFVFAMEVPAGFVPYCLEEELSTIGMVQLDQAMSHGEGAFENWSRIVMTNFSFA
jgi:predicted NUDIX family phosphoesterase